MQRIKTIKWPIKNPMGDRLFYKPLTVYGGVLVIPTTDSFVSQNLNFNDPVAIAALWGNSPGVDLAGNNFGKFRVRGISLKITVWPDATSAGTPICVYTNAAGDAGALVPTPTVSRVTEQRWSKYRVCRSAATGATPTVLKVYYSVNKILGPDNIIKNDADYVGDTNFTNIGGWTPPAVSPVLQYGLFTMSGLNPTAPINATVKIESKYYLEFFEKFYRTT